jgi:biotin-(acetyl-CoA carboxylase) ligase/biotin operon repressor
MVYMTEKHNTKNYFLKILEENRGKPVLGSAAAKKLNISRSAVWQTVKALKKDGYLIESVPNRGYTLLESNDLISVSGIIPYLRDPSLSSNISVSEVLESTNKTAKIFALDGAPHGTVVISDSQTDGKGRGGKLFYSPKSAGLYMSIILHPSALGLSNSVEFAQSTAYINSSEIKQKESNESEFLHSAAYINSSEIKQKEPNKSEFTHSAAYANSSEIKQFSSQIHQKEPLKTAAVITQIAAAATVLAITKVCGIEPQIRRVNDIYFEDKKISGILTEIVADLETGNIQFAVVGVGINTGISEFPDELKAVAASVFSPSGNTRNRLAAEIINSLLSPTSPSFIDDLLNTYKKSHSENK